MKELLKALSDVQSELADPVRNTDGYGYQYAELHQILTSIREACSKHGLLVVQAPSSEPGDIVTVTTTIYHVGTGQSISSTISGSCAGSSKMAQAIGSMITYLRRYSLMPMFSMAPVDDDGAAVSTAEAKKPSKDLDFI